MQTYYIVFNVLILILQIRLFCCFIDYFPLKVYKKSYLLLTSSVYQLNPVQFNTNTEVGEVIFICTYINKVFMFH